MTPKHESDGRFALRLDSEAAVQRDMRREQRREARAKDLEQEMGNWAAEHNIDPSELRFLFA